MESKPLSKNPTENYEEPGSVLISIVVKTGLTIGICGLAWYFGLV